MKTEYIIALAAIGVYLLFRNSSIQPGNPVSCSSCGGSVGVTAVPTDVPTTIATVSSENIPVQGTIAIAQPPQQPLTTPAPIAQPILSSANTPTLTNFYIRGTPSAISL